MSVAQFIILHQLEESLSPFLAFEACPEYEPLCLVYKVIFSSPHVNVGEFGATLVPLAVPLIWM